MCTKIEDNYKVNQMNIRSKTESKDDQKTNWTDICLPDTVVILFNNSFTSSKRTIVRIKSIDLTENTIITTPPTCENHQDVIKIGSVFVAQISKIDGAIRFPVQLIKINTTTNEHQFSIPQKSVLIKHHNSLRVNTFVSGSIFNNSGNIVQAIETPIVGNISNTGIRLIFDNCVFRLRTRYFIVFILKHNLDDPDELSYSLKCKWNVSRIQEITRDNTTKYEVAGYFMFEDQDRDSLENFLSIQYK